MVFRLSPVVRAPYFGAFLVATFFASSTQLNAATITAASVSYSDVTAAIASSADGDTVIVPAGTAAWTSTLTVTKGISLLGSTTTSMAVTTATGASLGLNVNTFTGSQSLNVVSTRGFALSGKLDVVTTTGMVTVNYTGISGNSFTGCSCSSSGVIGSGTNSVGQGHATDMTIIQDNVSPRGTLLQITSSLGKSYRVSGLTFQQLATTRSTKALIVLTGNSHSLRFDHCHFSPNPYIDTYVKVSGPIYGVFDHNVMECYSVGGQGYSFGFRLYNGAWTDRMGHAAWTLPAGYGTGNWFFIEDNWIKNTAQSGGFKLYNGTTDGDYGGSAVFRYNHMYDVLISNHGTQGFERGGRAFEIYSNDFHYLQINQGAYGGARSGGWLSHDNTYDGNLLNGPSLRAYRSVRTYYGAWGIPVLPYWDVQDTSTGTYTKAANPALTGASSPANNTGTFNYSPVDGVYDSGSATGGSATTLSDTTKNWMTNQWEQFHVLRLKDGAIGYIVSNTNNTLTIFQGVDTTPVFVPGDGYEIRRPLILIDQPCRGQGDLITGTQPTTTVATASNGIDISSFTGTGVLNVKATTSFASSGTLQINRGGTGFTKGALVTYRGKTATSFTGCAAVSNASGVLATGNTVFGLYQGVKNNVTGTASWPNQALEPCYSWNDIYTPTGAAIPLRPTGNKAILQPGRDFFNGTPMPGYKPYTYPHPLVSEQPTRTAPESPPPATAASTAAKTPASRGGFGTKKRVKALSGKSKKIPGKSG